MHMFGRFVPVALAAIIAGALACGSSTDSGPQAASVTGVAGDSQTANTGATLAFPLSFTALGSNGQPAQGVHVTWSVVPSGAASFTPATTTTDVNGVASTTARLGGFVGNITIHAAVSGVSDVLYHATALDPCAYNAPFVLGDTVSAALATTDCNFRNLGFFYDFYQLDLPGQQSIRISMHANFPAPSQAPGDSNDTWIDFFTPAFLPVAFDDDSVLGGDVTDRGRNSQLDIVLPGGSYVIGPNSFNQFTTGPYTLAAVARPSAMNGCRQVWVLRGVTVSDSLTAATDCADSSATPRYYDVARVLLLQGSVLTISAHSTAINPRLTLYRILNLNTYPRSQVAQNDDSAVGNPNAFIKYTVPVNASGAYDILIGSSAPGETGAYTFDVSSSATSTSPVVPISGDRAPWAERGGLLRLPRRAKH